MRVVKNRIGLHIRLVDTLTHVIKKAIDLEIPFFQTFFMLPTGKHIKPTNADINEFLKLRRKYFNNLYVHGSYSINLCGPVNFAHKVLNFEIEMAKKLEFTHLVLHPGAHTTENTKLEGIEFLAKSLNNVLKKEKSVNIILENTAHGKRAIGSDIQDFGILKEKLEYPEKISFCIDTAHAYSFGYDLVSFEEQSKFIQLINNILGINNISLIHLNDTLELLGSKIDTHYIPGKGNIGKETLKNFIENKNFVNVPIIAELPNLSETEEKQALSEIKNWLL